VTAEMMANAVLVAVEAAHAYYGLESDTMRVALGL
jgi:hypothetical protein